MPLVLEYLRRCQCSWLFYLQVLLGQEPPFFYAASY